MTALAVCLLPILSGCGTFGSPPLTVAIPADCERIAQPVADPGVTADGRVTIARTRAAFGVANRRLIKSNKCFSNVRTRFSRGG